MRTVKQLLFCCCFIFGVSAVTPADSNAQTDPYIGQVATFGFNFCPRGWTPAQGQLLSIAQNTALFSLYGTMYGGDGRTTFALPDLRGRAVVTAGQSPGLHHYPMGARGGIETVTLSIAEMPSHNHPGTASGVSSATATMTGTATATVAATQEKILRQSGSDSGVAERSGGTSDGTISAPTVTVSLDNLAISSIDVNGLAVTTHNVGGNQAHENRMPYLAMTSCVALVGVFPSRN
ncbi:MAG: tail fiber protein [Bacteroidota bacterium]